MDVLSLALSLYHSLLLDRSRRPRAFPISVDHCVRPPLPKGDMLLVFAPATAPRAAAGRVAREVGDLGQKLKSSLSTVVSLGLHSFRS